jgi:hypothetical protein
MQSSIEKLRKFFRLEHENGYTNTAVIGGLANVLSLWEGEARNDKLPEEIVQATSATLQAYADLTPAERLDSLKVLWKQIVEKVPEAALLKKQSSAKTAQRPPQPMPPSVPERTETGGGTAAVYSKTSHGSGSDSPAPADGSRPRRKEPWRNHQ